MFNVRSQLSHAVIFIMITILVMHDKGLFIAYNTQRDYWWHSDAINCVSTDKELAYRKTTNIKPTLVRNKIIDHSDVVEASPVGASPTTSSFST